MMRILQVITKGDVGGAQRVLKELIDGLKDVLDFEVAVGRVCEPLRSDLMRMGIRVRVVPELVREISPFEDIKALFKLFSLMKSGEYDLVHTHSSKAGVLGRIAACMARIPSIHTVHGWWGILGLKGIKRYVAILMERISALCGKKLILLSEYDRDLSESFKIPGEKVIVPNSIKPFDFRRGVLREELNLDDSIKIVGNVARLVEPKDPELFARIAESFHSENTVFIWIGDGDLKGVFKGTNVVLLGEREDARDLMADFDVFLLTSKYEGMPIAVLEALHMGVPVLSRWLPQLRDLPISFYSDVDEAVEKLEEILSNPPKVDFQLRYEDFIDSYLRIYRSFDEKQRGYSHDQEQGQES